MKLTYEDTEMIMTPKGGFKRLSLELIGVSWPPLKGWRERVVGTEIDEQDFLRAIELSESPTKKQPKAERKRRSKGQQPLF